jgi:hypothetical protein
LTGGGPGIVRGCRGNRRPGTAGNPGCRIDSSGALLRVAATVQAGNWLRTREQVAQLPSICCGG